MGSDRTRILIVAALLSVGPTMAQEPGWHYSPLPGEGDRATLGCDRDATQDEFTCLAVRCEDDYSAGIHIFTSRAVADGTWEMTLDRENRSAVVQSGVGPYGGRFSADEAWLLERLQQGTFVYLRHVDDSAAPFRFIALTGSLYAINAALAWCAPRVDRKSVV